MKKIKITNEFYEKLLKLKGKIVLKPMSEQVATDYEKDHAKELAIKYQGKYGFPKLKN